MGSLDNGEGWVTDFFCKFPFTTVITGWTDLSLNATVLPIPDSKWHSYPDIDYCCFLWITLNLSSLYRHYKGDGKMPERASRPYILRILDEERSVWPPPPPPSVQDNNAVAAAAKMERGHNNRNFEWPTGSISGSLSSVQFARRRRFEMTGRARIWRKQIANWTHFDFDD